MDMQSEQNKMAMPKQRETVLALAAHQHAIVASLLGNHASKLCELTGALGSPLHIVLPQIVHENIARLQDVFTANNINGTLLYAQKANKANCFSKVCADADIGVEVASAEELKHTLACGVAGERTGVSGPEKNDSFLTLALRHRCLIAVDSVNELQRITLLSTQLQSNARILLRIRPEAQKTSRFGLTEQECENAFALCVQHNKCIRLEGFSFHLGGYSLPERAEMTNVLIDLCLHAQALGLVECWRVDMGGISRIFVSLVLNPKGRLFSEEMGHPIISPAPVRPQVRRLAC